LSQRELDIDLVVLNDRPFGTPFIYKLYDVVLFESFEIL
jgi:hypothetical protein